MTDGDNVIYYFCVGLSFIVIYLPTNICCNFCVFNLAFGVDIFNLIILSMM